MFKLKYWHEIKQVPGTFLNNKNLPLYIRTMLTFIPKTVLCAISLTSSVIFSPEVIAFQKWMNSSSYLQYIQSKGFIPSPAKSIFFFPLI